MPEYEGKPVAKGLSERLTALQKFTSPSESLGRLETFAKWLFATVATVGSLGAALSTAGFVEPQRLGKWVFGFAIVVLGGSLAFAAVTLAPKWVRANPNSIDSMENAIARTFAGRRGLVRIAAYLFASAILLAGLTPIASNWDAPWEPTADSPTLTLSLSEGGALIARLDAQGLKRFSELKATVEIEEPAVSSSITETEGTPAIPTGSESESSSTPGNNGAEEDVVLLPSAIATADKEGNASVQLDLSRVTEIASSLKVIASYLPKDGTKNKEETILVEIRPRPAPSVSVLSRGEGEYRVVFRTKKGTRRKPIIIRATSFSDVGPWLEFTSRSGGGMIPILRVRSADVAQVRRMG